MTNKDLDQDLSFVKEESQDLERTKTPAKGDSDTATMGQQQLSGDENNSPEHVDLDRAAEMAKGDRDTALEGKPQVGR